MIPELFAVGTGIASFLQKDEEYDRRIKMKNDTINSLKDLMIDSNERTSRLDKVSDMFNPAIMNDLNNSAVNNAVSGVLNPVAYSQLIPQKSAAIAKESSAIDERNTTIGEKISELSLMDIPKPGVFDFLEGGMAGYGMGSQIEGMIDEGKRQNKMMDLLDLELKKETGSGMNMGSIAKFGNTKPDYTPIDFSSLIKKNPFL